MFEDTYSKIEKHDCFIDTNRMIKMEDLRKTVRSVHAEIEYLKPNNEKIHSDICPPKCSADNLTNEEWRKFLHGCLDEWLDNSNGTCGFYIKDVDYNFDCE